MKLTTPRRLLDWLRRVWLARRAFRLGNHVVIDRSARIGYPAGVSIGDRVRIDLGSAIRANTKQAIGVALADDVSIKDYCVVNANAGSVVIGERSWIGPYSLIYGNGGVTIGSDVLIAARTSINTVSHIDDRLDVAINSQGLRCDPVVIEDDVWIGMNCTILQGVRIGSGAIVGAGSVVTSDVPPRAIVVGTPARVLRYRGVDEATRPQLAAASLVS